MNIVKKKLGLTGKNTVNLTNSFQHFCTLQPVIAKNREIQYSSKMRKYLGFILSVNNFCISVTFNILFCKNVNNTVIFTINQHSQICLNIKVIKVQNRISTEDPLVSSMHFIFTILGKHNHTIKFQVCKQCRIPPQWYLYSFCWYRQYSKGLGHSYEQTAPTLHWWVQSLCLFYIL